MDVESVRTKNGMEVCDVAELPCRAELNQLR
jgi:hypothetical protein